MKLDTFVNSKIDRKLVALYTVALKGMGNLNGVIIGHEVRDDNIIRVTISVRDNRLDNYGSYKMYYIDLEPREE